MIFVACTKKITVTKEVIETHTSKFTILKDKVYRVLELPHKTLNEVYIPPSLRPLLLHHYHNDPYLSILEDTRPIKGCKPLCTGPRV